MKHKDVIEKEMFDLTQNYATLLRILQELKGIDWENIEVDTPMFVFDSLKTMKDFLVKGDAPSGRQHYSHCGHDKTGRVMTFQAGRTSHTISSLASVDRWNFAIPVSEAERLKSLFKN